MKLILLIMVLPTLVFSINFPTITGKTLQEENIKVPNQRSNQLIIIGFDMKSSEPMEAWVRALNLTPTSNISWLQIPVIGGVPPFVDGFIKNGMKKSIPKPIQSNFFPYFGKKKNDIIQAISGKNELADTITPFIILLAENGEIKLSKQAVVSTENVKLIQSKL